MLWWKKRVVSAGCGGIGLHVVPECGARMHTFDWRFVSAPWALSRMTRQSIFAPSTIETRFVLISLSTVAILGAMLSALSMTRMMSTGRVAFFAWASDSAHVGES